MKGTKLLTVVRRILWVAVVASSGSAFADAPLVSIERDIPNNVLFVGNSFIYYNNSLHNHYKALVGSSKNQFDIQPVTRSMTISGAYLPEHAAGLPSVLAGENWDVVILQGNSLGPITEATAGPFREAATRYSKMVREQNGRPVLFMTWAYADRPEMTAQLNAAYTDMGRELGAQVVPVGLAFATVTDERPDIVLRMDDARHPTLAGTYLAACTFFAAFFNQSPEGLEYSAGLDTSDAEFLKKIAWETVLNYQE
jgi:hypothetical protein